MKVQLRFFAILREQVGHGSAEHELSDGASVAQLWSSLCASYPQLQPHGASVSFAVNREYVDRQHCLSEGDEVALIPPVSGG